MKSILNINLLQNKQKSSKAFKSHITVYTIQHIILGGFVIWFLFAS